MLKKLIPIILCFCLCLNVGCSKKKDSLELDESSAPIVSQIEEEKPKILNPLTGLADISEKKADDRPVAIMVNNVAISQPIQTGLNDADIIYETEVEYGITRLLAVYQDISKVEKIGSVRSSRYVYIDLAMGHDAVYVHHGVDPNYAKPHLADTDNFVLDTNNAGVRISNNLAWEHTLYGYGKKIWSQIASSNRKTEKKNPSPWQTFADVESPVEFADAATTVSVPFSSNYKTTFKYNSETKRYSRYFNGTLRKDYYTGKAVTVKNVFVLNANMSHYAKPIYRKIDLTSGTGYYFSNGTYTPIKWKKGSASSPLVITNTDGTELTVNPGNSWVCIADKNTSKPIIK